MSEKIRVALLSFWHSHAIRSDEVRFKGKGIYGEVKDHPEVEIVTSWDDDATRGRKGADELGVPFDPDLESVLSREDVDGVVIINETTRHAELAIAAARHKKHIYITKVLSPTFSEAQEVIRACDDAGIVIVTMLSRLSMPWAQKIRDLIADGTIGKLISLRIWHAHGLATKYSEADGAGYLPDGHGFLTERDGGGGAYVDMCHPQYLAPYLLGGAPDSVFGRKSSASGRGDVEDNAVVLLDYPGGPYVILEEGWASAPQTTFVEVQGTDGTILYVDDKADPGRNVFGVRSGDAATFSAVDPGPATGTPLDEWIGHIRNGTRPDENIERTLLLSKMNEAAYRSFESHVPVRLEAIS
ncbi:Gfo/Idh/MocA family protein [Jiella avicenniae]|uniref:Gfo/Idh/MocA family oxidoreductase n=1 Tax=Jiella avicenniae TaxID=2907202 RepID=A0A9X1P4G5_9HYPH|nr:Gfo/Idh/MocA family oxidoreductase [Jiella avicenniae]MCE7029684.1 Gfo/Idh/MocA family oxidoreductase [Jiella avicenniae]